MPRILLLALCAVSSALAIGQELPNRPGLTIEEDSAWIVTTTRVSRQIRLDPTQQAKVSSAFATLDHAEQTIFSHGPATVEQLNTLDRKLAATVLGSLTAQQRIRLHQIALQLKGPFILDDAAETSEIALTGQQKAKIHSIVQTSERREEDFDDSAGKAMMQRANSSPAEKAKFLAALAPQRQALAKKRHADAQKILNLLTVAQQGKWQSILGERMP